MRLAEAVAATVSRTEQKASRMLRSVHGTDHRSAVTNGKRLHAAYNGRGLWVRRFKDVLAEITNDLGGADLLSEGQRQLARRAATISIACERMEGRAVTGTDIDLEEYGRLTDRLGRTFQRLGLRRQARTVEPTLNEYVRANYGHDEGATE
jgi:hypothetical protein